MNRSVRLLTRLAALTFAVFAVSAVPAAAQQCDEPPPPPPATSQPSS